MDPGKLTPITRIKNSLYKTVKYCFGIYALDIATQIAKNESLTAAITHLKEKYKRFQPPLVRFLLNLYNYLLSTPLSTNVKSHTSFIIHFCCWGESYCKKAESYLLPSLLSDGNLPAIAKTHKTTLLIHCDLHTKNKFLASRVVKKIREYADIEFFIIPQALLKYYRANFKYPKFLFFKKILEISANVKYFFLGGLQNQALEIALKNKTYISFLMPDIVVSENFLSKLFSMIKDKKVVVATALRTNHQSASKKIDHFFKDKEKTQLAVPAQILRELQITHMHRATKRLIISNSNYHFSPSAQLLFETAHGFILRALHYHPVLLDCYQHHYTIKKDYYPIDSTLLNQILADDLPFDEKIAICDDASKGAFIELSEEKYHEPHSRRVKKLNYSELLQTVSKMILKRPETYNTPLNHYFYSIKNNFEFPTLSKKGNFISEDKFSSDLENFIRQTSLMSQHNQVEG